MSSAGPPGAPAPGSRVRLDADADPAAVVVGLVGEPDSAVLWGQWFAPGAARQLLVLRSPTRTVVGHEAVLRALDDEPAVTPGGPLIGGGWVVCLGYDSETAWARHYDHLLRWGPDEGWVFEALPGVTSSPPAPGEEPPRLAALASARDLLAQVPPKAAGAAAGIFTTRESPTRARERYLAAVEEVIGRIDHGEYYQLNLCTRLHADVTGDRGALFADLIGRLNPAFGAWLPHDTSTGLRTVLSCSPELFLTTRGNSVMTAPIKGTARRRPGDDGAAELRSSAKDAAENVMITDLMRNDLSRICTTGSVAVTGLLEVQAHPGVWHLVSTVQGRLVPGTTVGSLLRATFPPGSVTGAPKSSAVRGIAALESEGRGAYTGTAGLISPLAGADLSVLIRSFEAIDPPEGPGRLALGVGAGITVDSVPVREWHECLDKAAPLVSAAGGELAAELRRTPATPLPALRERGVFESVLVLDGRPIRLAGHLARLDRSCRELYATGLPDDLANRVRAVTGGLQGRHAVTVHASPRPSGDGGLTIDLATRPLPPRTPSGTLAWHPRPSGCWRHKWRDRRMLQEAEQAVAPALPYFTDTWGRVTETSRGNLFVLSADGSWVTPPLEEEVLPGVTRREALDLLMDAGERVRIASVRPEDLRTGRPVFWTSSLSGAVAITAVDSAPLATATDLLTALNEQLVAGRR